ncbi:MAG: hypothetical protein GF365_04725 [Candidatus Buchananbacteria bacterium]|nr:hypothetical protein [Candidatus Buchananbacteria bacterium]
MVQGKVSKGHDGPKISLKKNATYFKEIIEKLLNLAEYEYNEFGEKVPFIREGNLQEHLGSLGYHPNTVMPKMMANGYLKIKLSEPPGYYLILEGDQEKTTIILPTKKLRQLARRFWLSADRDIIDGEKKLRFQYLKIIQQKLAGWGYDPDSLIEQMEAKNYLVKRSKGNEPISYWIFKTQKQGKEF